MEFNWYKALNGELGEDARKNTERCKNIASHLDDIVDGLVYIDKDGRLHSPQMELETDEVIPKNWKQYSLVNYLEDNYGVWCIVDYNAEVSSVKICVACGGPNIYLDSSTELVEFYWWTTIACYPLSDRVVEELDAWGSDYFDNRILPQAIAKNHL